MNKLFQYKFVIAIVAITIFTIMSIGAIFKVMHWPWANEMLILGGLGVMTLFFFSLYDMIVSPIKKRALWILSLCIAPMLVCLIYIFLREDILVTQEP